MVSLVELQLPVYQRGGSRSEAAAHPDPTRFPSPADALDLRRTQVSVAAQTASRPMGPWMRQMDFGSPSRSFPACVPRGRDRPRPRPASQEAGQERLACLPPLCPPGSAPPGLALEDTSQGAWSQDTWGTRQRAAATHPSPSLRWGCLSWPFLLALFSFTFLFVGGWDSLGSRRPGKPQLICLWPQRPDAREGSRVTAPAPLHCLPPLTLQPGVDGESIPTYGHMALQNNVSSCAMLVMSQEVKKSMLADSQHIGGHVSKVSRITSCSIDPFM
ncbi:interleukin-15 isoform X1 [Bos javanicus]|uniref:interleukin-15 isoform X1 n=1 Tax=Bos javanicus TaxID=9906 RepID=UPI002AA8C0AD|nr:interleukin-15 isoform X1 [Bos javanicus]